MVFSLGSAVISVSALQTLLLYREFRIIHQQRSRSFDLDFVMKQNKKRVVLYCEMKRFRLLYLLKNKNQHSKSFCMDVYQLCTCRNRFFCPHSSLEINLKSESRGSVYRNSKVCNYQLYLVWTLFYCLYL